MGNTAPIADLMVVSQTELKRLKRPDDYPMTGFLCGS